MLPHVFHSVFSRIDLTFFSVETCSYEPVWAIGTGKVGTRELHAIIVLELFFLG
jgi:triosephosphate isomerase